MGTLVLKIESKPRRVANAEVHSAVAAYKPCGQQATNERWHNRFVRPSELSWMRKKVIDQTNVLCIRSARPFDGLPVYEVPTVNGNQLFTDLDFEERTKIVGMLRKNSEGKLFVLYNN